MQSRQLGFSASYLFKSLFLFSIGVLLLEAGARQASAQVDRAVLEGTVTDPSGGVVVGVAVKLRAVDTSLSELAPTNSKGYYRFPGLAVGRYEVTATGTGFRTKVIDDVVMRVGQTRTLDIQLAVGAINEQVEVRATLAPADRVSAEAATVIDIDQVSQLPNNGRDCA